MHHFHSYILKKTPLKLVNWFQRYDQLKDAKNNRKQKDIFCFVWFYLKINISKFRLILLDHITNELSFPTQVCATLGIIRKLGLFLSLPYYPPITLEVWLNHRYTRDAYRPILPYKVKTQYVHL